MDPRLKRRLFIAVIIVILVVIFVPMLFEHLKQEKEKKDIFGNIPPMPVESGVVEDSQVMPNQTEIRDVEAQQMGRVDKGSMTPQAQIEPQVSDSEAAASPIEPNLEANVPAAAVGPTRLSKLAVPTPVKLKPLPPHSHAHKTLPARLQAHHVHKKIQTLQASANKPLSQTKKTIPASGEWVIQIGSFPTVAKAKTVLTQLKKRGFPMISESMTVNGHLMHRVYIGPYQTRHQATQKASQLKMPTYVHQIGK